VSGGATFSRAFLRECAYQGFFLDSQYLCHMRFLAGVRADASFPIMVRHIHLSGLATGEGKAAPRARIVVHVPHRSLGSVWNVSKYGAIMVERRDHSAEHARIAFLLRQATTRYMDFFP